MSTPLADRTSPVSELAQVLPASAELTADGHLAIGGCDLVALAEEYGTPLVAYDEGALRSTLSEYRDAFAAESPDTEVIYASKAYFGLAMLRLVAELGLSVDVASGGELHAALAAGIAPDRIHMHGNNKDRRELEELVAARVGTVIVDNFDEIGLLAAVAGAAGRRRRVLVRVTPGVDAVTHAHIATGQVDSKFGFGLADDQAAEAVAAIRAAAHLELVGLHAHIGSQLLDLEGTRSAAAVLADFALAIGGGDVRMINMGGGLGIAYTRDQRPPAIAEYAAAVVGAVRAEWGRVGLPLPRILVEPGRSVVGRAGVSVYRVGSVKRIPGVRTYVAVDGGMSDLLRPMLYGATYEAILANRAGEPATTTPRVVGKHCESGDVLVREAHLPEVAVGDLVCLPATGAYGVAMASNYNGVTRPPVVFVMDGESRLVTRRETYEDLLRREL